MLLVVFSSPHIFFSMNRGRRRGGGPNLSGLRDGVKRRLFDPHSVPTKPDPKFEVSRLIPFSVPKVTINSSLSDSSTNNNPDVVKDDIDSLQINLVCIKLLDHFHFLTCNCKTSSCLSDVIFMFTYQHVFCHSWSSLFSIRELLIFGS